MDIKIAIETIKKEKGLSNKDLAKILGCDESSIYYIIQGKRSGKILFYTLIEKYPELIKVMEV